MKTNDRVDIIVWRPSATWDAYVMLQCLVRIVYAHTVGEVQCWFDDVALFIPFCSAWYTSWHLMSWNVHMPARTFWIIKFLLLIFHFYKIAYNYLQKIRKILHLIQYTFATKSICIANSNIVIPWPYILTRPHRQLFTKFDLHIDCSVMNGQPTQQNNACMHQLCTARLKFVLCNANLKW